MDVQRELIDFLRTATGTDSLRLFGPLQKLTGGFDTEVFAFRLESAPPEVSGPLVLRLHRSPRESRKARIETAVLSYASGKGYPVPAIPVDATGHTILGRPFLVMERVPGIPLITALSDPAVLKSVPRLMARVQSGLHSLSTAGLIKALEQRGVDPASLTPFHLLDDTHRLMDEANLVSLRPLVDWLDGHRSPEPAQKSICHGDFHPGNILVDGGRVTGVIDWPNVTLGHPEFDVAITLMILSIGPVEGWGDPSSASRKGIDAAVAEFLAAYRERRPLDDGLLDYYTVLRAAHAFAKVAAATVAPGVRGVAHDHYAWRHPAVLRAAAGAVERVTGIALRLPGPGA